MGNQIIKKHVMLLGLTNSGKTHFANIMENRVAEYLRPTEGISQYKINYKENEIFFLDIGGGICEIKDSKTNQVNEKIDVKRVWLKQLKSNDNIDVIYYFIDAEDDLESLYISRNELFRIVMSPYSDGISLCIIHNVKKNSIKKKRNFKQLISLLNLETIKNSIPLCIIEIDYMKDDPINKLLEWTISQKK